MLVNCFCELCFLFSQIISFKLAPFVELFNFNSFQSYGKVSILLLQRHLGLLSVTEATLPVVTGEITEPSNAFENNINKFNIETRCKEYVQW